MTKDKIQASRRRWVQGIIDGLCHGNKAEFGRQIGKDGSYVARMLYEDGKKGAKRIGEDTVRDILAAFPQAGAPQGEVISAPDVEPAVHESLDAQAVRMTLASIVQAMVKTVPPAGEVFWEHLKAQAKRAQMRTDKGLLRIALDIAQPGRHESEETAPPLRRLGSERKPR